MLETKVCIIGGGPAGSMAALRLAKDDIPYILLEKESFPRKKICGDALSGKVPHIIRRLSPDILERFESFCNPLHAHGIQFIAPGNHVFDVPFIEDYDPDIHPVPGYTIKRELFDDFMLKEVKDVSADFVNEGEEVRQIERREDGFLISTGNKEISAKLLIDASGQASAFAPPYHKPKSSNAKTALAVRTYYKGVSGLHPQNFIELYFLEDLLPGYFWLFPLPGGMVNAGVGIRKDVVLRKKINISAILVDIINSHPMLAPRFKNAEQHGKPAAHPLPLGFPRFRISGDGYMLAGDAAHLVDPLTGEGVGNALYSGYIAAEQAIDCLDHKRFDDAFMKAYDKRIKRVLGKEMKISANFQRMLKYPRMVKWIARKADGNKHIPGLMSSMFTDLNHRKKLLNPIFLLRVLLNK
ncbi:MAG: NAD(P)/FAD-dependent oxidoreductase [Bacteroidales bacterium]|jgi:geranylgeranyl reductase family protein|nr:NAD(P)/FAD-dependent oxidoreductase [Bacteroidales bacterium]